MPPSKEDEALTLEQLDGVLGPEGDESAADTLRGVMDEFNDDGAENAPDDKEQAPENEDKDAQRDDKGRFKTADTDKEPDGEDDGDKVEDDAEGKEKAAGDDADPVDPPADWTLEEQNAFRDLSPEAQKFVLNRVGATSEAQKKAQETAARYEALDKVIGDRAEAWARAGMTTDQALMQILSIADYANTKPQEFLEFYAKQNNIDLSRYGAPKTEDKGAGGEDDDADIDPVVSALQAEIAGLKGQIGELGGTLKGREDMERQTRVQNFQSEINKFSAATDEKGNALHPYFDQVRSVMSALMSSGQANDLSTAYDMACRAHPDVSAKTEAARKAQERRELDKKARAKAESARKAGGSVSGTPGSRATVEPTGDLREDLKAEFVAKGLL